MTTALVTFASRRYAIDVVTDARGADYFEADFMAFQPRADEDTPDDDIEIVSQVDREILLTRMLKSPAAAKEIFEAAHQDYRDRLWADRAMAQAWRRA